MQKSKNNNPTTSIYTWNVNGIRAIAKKGFLEFLSNEAPDILCLQETKAIPQQLPPEIIEVEGYQAHFASAIKRGYSGVATYTKIPPLEVEYLGIEHFDSEGRVLIHYFENFALINAYFPNSQENGRRLDYKLAFCQAIENKCNELEKMGCPVIVTGDFNIAHRPIDLENPEANTQNPGYLPQERAWMDHILQSGFFDAFRKFNQEGGNYTWWSYRTRARPRNIGWRIDSHLISDSLEERLISSKILSDIMGSDHCPVKIEFS